MSISAISTAAMADDHKGRHDGKKGEGIAIGKIIKDLPKEKQDQIKAILSKDGTKEKMKALMTERKAILTAKTFDKAAFVKNAEAVKSLKESVKADKDAKMAEVLSLLTQEERQKLADKMDKKRKDGGKKGKDGDKKRDHKDKKEHKKN